MNEELLDFILKVIANSHKCQHCMWCFCGGCINAYKCISNDFSEYEEEDN